MMPPPDKNTSVFPRGHIDRSGWKRVRLGDVGYTYNGLSGKTKQDFDAGDAFYIPFLNVLENTEIDINNLGRVNVSALEKQTCVQKNDLFFNTSSETPEEVGMCAYLSQELSNTFLNSFCFGFRLYNIHVAEPRFLVYLFNSAYGRRVISSLAQGVTRYNLSKERLLQSDIHLPPVTEQLRIASCINIVEKNLVEMQTLISKYDAIKKATVNLLLKPKAGWKRVKLGDVFEVKVGGDLDVPHYSPYKTIDCRYEIVSNSLTNHGHYGYTSLPNFPGDSITVTGRGNVGHAEYRQEPFDAIVRTVILSPNCAQVCSKFVAELINATDTFLIESTGVPQLTAPQIASTSIALPPLDEQNRIVEILDSLDGTITGLKSQLAKAQDIKQGMMSYFFG